MTASPTRPVRLPLVLAALLPLLVLGVGAVHLSSPPDLSTRAVEFDRELAKARPEVIVMGSSLANRGIDLDVLAREVNVPADRLLVMQLPHSSLAHWYAMLKNRVFANGYRPKVVVVVGAMTTMLNHDQLKFQPNVERLIEQLSPDEPEIARKVFKVDDVGEFRELYARARASRYRERLLLGVRDSLLTVFFTEHGKPGEARKLADKINEEVFSNANMDYELHNNQATGLGSSSTPPLVLAEDEPFELRRDGMLDVFQELAEAHETKVVYVRYPFPPSNRDMDEVPPEIEADAVAWMQELGAGFLDMRALDLDETQYEDMRHMTRQGAQTFTAAIGRALMAMDALGSGSGVGVIRGLAGVGEAQVRGEPALPDLGGLRLDADCKARVRAGALASLDRSTMEELGQPPAPYLVTVGGQPLGQLAGGEGCVGAAWVEDGMLIVSPPTASLDGVEIAWRWEVEGPAPTGMRWVAPGSTHAIRFEQAWTLPDNTFRVYARALRVGDHGTVSLRVKDEAFELRERDGRMAAVARLTPPREPGWDLEVSVPPDGSFALLHHLAIGVAPTTTYLLGMAETLHGSSVRVVGGRVEDVKHRPTFAAEPPPLPSQPRVRRGPKGTGAFEMDLLAELADAVDKTSSRPNRCSPLVVTEDGEPLTKRHATCLETANRKEGRSCFAGEVLYFSASDDSNPLLNNRTYEAELVPSRLCETYNQKGAATLRDSYWLYPGDVATFIVPEAFTKDFIDGINQLEVEVIPHVAAVDKPVMIRLFQGDELLVEQEWAPQETLRRRRERVAIWPPLPPRTVGLRIELSNPSKSFVLVTKLSVGEDYGVFAVEDEVPVARSAAAPPPPADRHPDRWSRLGTPTPISDIKAMGKTTFEAYEARVFPLWPISTSVLETEGRGQVTPVRMRVGGEELVPRVTKKGLRSGCTSCFLHQGQALVYYAPAGPDAPIEVYYDDRFPFLGPDGMVAWWVYPGTTGRFELDTAWTGAGATVIVEGFAFHPKRELRGTGVVARAAGVQVPFEAAGGQGAARATIKLPTDKIAPWAIEVEASGPSASFLVERIFLVDELGKTALLPMTAAQLGLGEPTP